MVKAKYKDRYVAFYLPDDETLPRWKAFAKTTEATTFSGFICSAVEDSIDRKNNPRPAVYVESRELLEENARLREKLQKFALLSTRHEEDISRMEAEVNRMKLITSQWINLNSNFIKMLVKNCSIEEIQSALKGDENAYEQLEALQKAGIVVETPNGWKKL